MRLGKLPLITSKGVFRPSSASPFPEDCARLKLSSARASQAGLKEMMMQMKNESSSDEVLISSSCATLSEMLKYA